MRTFFTKLLTKLSGMLQNAGPRWSSTRFAFILAVILSNFIIFGLWLGLSINQQELLPIDNSILILYGLANGISFGGKLIAKPMEGKNHSTKSENTPTP